MHKHYIQRENAFLNWMSAVFGDDGIQAIIADCRRRLESGLVRKSKRRRTKHTKPSDLAKIRKLLKEGKDINEIWRTGHLNMGFATLRGHIRRFRDDDKT